MDHAQYSFTFGHEGQAMRAIARRHGEGWTLTVEDELGRVRCTWRPDTGLFRGDPANAVPPVLHMLAELVQDEVIPLTPAGDLPGWPAGPGFAEG